MRRRTDYITPQGAKVLRDELKWLWEVERPRITREVSDAAAEGDRSENASYIYGKKRLREIDRRVRFLGKRLDVLKVVEPQRRTDGKIYFAAWVRVEDDSGNVADYRLVGPDEFDIDKGHISVDSPLGIALMGKRKGDEVTVRRPKGELELVLTTVWYLDADAPADAPLRAKLGSDDAAGSARTDDDENENENDDDDDDAGDLQEAKERKKDAR